MKNSFLICLHLLPIMALTTMGQTISSFNKLPKQQLLDTANYFFDQNSTDMALACYSSIINTPVKDADVEQQQIIVEAYNKAAAIYYYMCDYKSAYEFLIKALLLCEKYNYLSYESTIYNNIGNIYYHFKQYDIAKYYYEKALNLCNDSTRIIMILNNLGAIELEIGTLDSAFFYLNQSLQISKTHNDMHLHTILNTIASIYKKSKQYNSALKYFKLALNEAEKHSQIEKKAKNLSDLGNLFFKINKMDSALFYLHLSNTIAEENSFLRILAENYLTLSKIEEAKGRKTSAFEHYKKYVNLKDSVHNATNLGDINQLQRLYEVSKTNQQIEQLVVEQQIKERTIYYQRIIQFITWGVLLLISAVLLIILFQKRRLDVAYKALFEKNIEIIELQHNSSEKHPEKYKKSALTDDMQHELMDRILALMKDTSIICDTEFSLDKLAELVQSNHAYVSQVINTALKKNFRSFLNSYRIREAQQLFSELDTAKYTIDSVAFKVGFKSPSAFRSTFKEITGVSPTFYLKAIREGARGNA